MESKGLQPDTIVYANVLDCMAHTQKMDEALKYLESLEEVGLLLCFPECIRLPLLAERN